MAGTTRPLSARDRGKLARLRCAGAPRYGGVGWRRDDKRCATSVGHSYRVSECREAVRTQLLRDSTDSGRRWRHFCSTCKSSDRSGLWDAGKRSRRSPRRWTVRSCTPFGLLRGGIHRESCRGPAGFCLRSSRGFYPMLTRQTAATHRRWSELLHGTRDTAESTKAVCCMLPAPRKNTQVRVSQWRRRGVRRKQRRVHHQTGSRPRLRRFSAKPNSRQRCSLTWKISLAGWPSSKSVGLLPSIRLADVLNGGGSGGRGVQRLDRHAQVQHSLRTRHECTGVIIMAHETRVQEDLMTLPGLSWS